MEDRSLAIKNQQIEDMRGRNVSAQFFFCGSTPKQGEPRCERHIYFYEVRRKFTPKELRRALFNQGWAVVDGKWHCGQCYQAHLDSLSMRERTDLMLAEAIPVELAGPSKPPRGKPKRKVK